MDTYAYDKMIDAYDLMQELTDIMLRLERKADDLAALSRCLQYVGNPVLASTMGGHSQDIDNEAEAIADVLVTLKKADRR